MAKFHIELTAEVEISEAVLKDGLSDEFAKYITRMHSREDVAKFVAFNLLVNGITLNQIDGFALHKEGAAHVDRRSIEVEATEIKEPPKKKTRKKAVR